MFPNRPSHDAERSFALRAVEHHHRRKTNLRAWSNRSSTQYRQGADPILYIQPSESFRHRLSLSTFLVTQSMSGSPKRDPLTHVRAEYSPAVVTRINNGPSAARVRALVSHSGVQWCGNDHGERDSFDTCYIADPQSPRQIKPKPPTPAYEGELFVEWYVNELYPAPLPLLTSTLNPHHRGSSHLISAQSPPRFSRRTAGLHLTSEVVSIPKRTPY